MTEYSVVNHDMSWLFTDYMFGHDEPPRVIRCSSVVPVNAARALATDWSSIGNNSRLVVASGSLNFELSAELISSSFRFLMKSIQDGMLATSAARYPIRMDLSCGFQSLRPSGTRSSPRRVPAASRSSLFKNKSVIFMSRLL